MSGGASPGNLSLRCAQCDELIAAPGAGLYAMLPPAPPHAGYLEMRVVHRACAANYEEAHGSTVPWQFLEQLWPLDGDDTAR